MDSAVLTDRGLWFIAKVFNGCYANATDRGHCAWDLM